MSLTLVGVGPLPETSALIIDDDDVAHLLLKRQIAEFPESVAVTSMFDGDEAIQYFENGASQGEPEFEPPKLALLDINMPLIDGFEFLERFEAVQLQNAWIRTAILVMLGEEAVYERQRCGRFSCVKGFVAKYPPNATTLRQSLVDYF